MASELDKNWHHWENRRSHKIKPINYFYILLLSFFAFFPLMQNNLLWNEYDTVNRSFFLPLILGPLSSLVLFFGTITLSP